MSYFRAAGRRSGVPERGVYAASAWVCREPPPQGGSILGTRRCKAGATATPFMRIALRSVLVAVGLLDLRAGATTDSWLVRVEEPTGLYPRTNELIAVPYSKIGGRGGTWQVVDAEGRELPWQSSQEA